jgi:arginine/ornithine transport system permease protein
VSKKIRAAAFFLIYTSVSLYALRKINARFSLGVKRGSL